MIGNLSAKNTYSKIQIEFYMHTRITAEKYQNNNLAIQEQKHNATQFALIV